MAHPGRWLFSLAVLRRCSQIFVQVTCLELGRPLGFADPSAHFIGATAGYGTGTVLPEPAVISLPLISVGLAVIGHCH